LPTFRESAGGWFYPNIDPAAGSMYPGMVLDPSNENIYYGVNGSPAYNGNWDYWAMGDESLHWTPGTGVGEFYWQFSANGYPEDIILTHVIGFDVKAWDPGAPIYEATINGRKVSLAPGDPGWTSMALTAAASKVPWAYPWIGCGAFVDLGYGYYYSGGKKNPLQTAIPLANANPPGMPQPHFNLTYVNNVGLSRTYDTWSTHYAMNAQDGDPNHARKTDPNASNGFDDDGINGPDDPGESMYPPPYPYPLRAIQVKIRAFEPSSRQVREVTVTQDFLPR
jgi:hypothetical protein